MVLLVCVEEKSTIHDKEVCSRRLFARASFLRDLLSRGAWNGVWSNS
jgi:hypothetical protein